jgi:hypothetical protein
LEKLSENPASWLVFEPGIETGGVSPEKEEVKCNEEFKAIVPDKLPFWPEDTGILIVRATRSWIQYGTVGFAVFCILVGAVEALFGR